MINSISDLFQIEYPLIQAPMAGAQDHRLAIAVCEAGGLGSLPCAMLDADRIRSEVACIRASTNRPLNLNFFCHTAPEPNAERQQAWLNTLAPYFSEWDIDTGDIPSGTIRQPFSEPFANVIEDLKPEVVSFHFGLPADTLLARVRSSGAKIMATATTLEEALWLEAKGVDAIIAQGIEAGGHRGSFLSADVTRQMGTLALVPQLVQRVKTPVIAAGGIASSEGVAAVAKLGAAGVQIGTAYLLCPESTISALHRQALQSEQRYHTAITNVFTGRPARGIVNRLIREIGPLHAGAPAFPMAATAVTALRTQAEKQGRDEFSPMWAGQNTTGCREVSATELTQQLLDSY